MLSFYLGFINVAHADVTSLVKKVNSVIINPIIVLMFGAALAYFVWGVAEFIAHASSDEGRSTGREHMIWGVVGMFIMISVFGIMQLIMNTLGVTGISPRG